MSGADEPSGGAVEPSGRAPAPRRMLFCDFDGTLSAGETFADLLRNYAADAEQHIARIHDLSLPLHVGVRAMLESIPSDRYAQALADSDAVPLRAGLPELLDFCDGHRVPFVVVSGGLEDMIRRKLGPLTERVAAIHALQIDATGPFLAPRSAFEEAPEFVSKPAVMAHHLGPEGRAPKGLAAVAVGPDAGTPIERVAIGDSTTDLRMACLAERVFARDRLCAYLDDRDVAYTPFETFHDVRAALEAAWGPAPAAPGGSP